MFMHSLNRSWSLFIAACLVACSPGPLKKVSESNTSRSPEKLWVFFADKANVSAETLNHTRAALEPRTVTRREARGTLPSLVDANDLPIDAARVEAVTKAGARHIASSRWLNAVSVLATPGQRTQIEALSFVDTVRSVLSTRLTADPDAIGPGTSESFDAASSPGNFHGRSRLQIEQMRLDELHDLGFTGKGVVVAVLDTGFSRNHQAFRHPDHPLDVTAEWDFMGNDPATSIEPGDGASQHHHGTMVLAALAGYLPGQYVGTAYDASYVLAKVEDAASEFALEEDWFVAGLELAEAHGADVVSSSVVANFYGNADQDGQTSVMALAVSLAASRGLHVVQGAGNSGHDSNPETNHLVTPADAYTAITVGAVDRFGRIASFSSDGPTVDGRVKPEVLALGAQVITVDPAGTARYRKINGTSLATPLVAGLVACLVQAHPDWTVAQMRSALFSTARGYAETHQIDADLVRGYGLVDAMAAHQAKLCTGKENLFQVSCTVPQGGGGHRLVVRFRRAEPFAVGTLRLDGDVTSDHEVWANAKGQGRAVFRNVAAGDHDVELLQCGQRLQASCG